MDLPGASYTVGSLRILRLGGPVANVWLLLHSDIGPLLIDTGHQTMWPLIWYQQTDQGRRIREQEADRPRPIRPREEKRRRPGRSRREDRRSVVRQQRD